MKVIDKERRVYKLIKDMTEVIDCRMYFVIGLIFTAIKTTVPILMPLIFKKIIDLGIQDKNIKNLYVYVLLGLAIVVTQNIVMYLFNKLALKKQIEYSLSVREKLIGAIGNKNDEYFKTNSVGYIHSVILNDVEAISSVNSTIFFDIVSNIIIFVGIILIMFYMNYFITIIILLVQTVIMWFNNYMAKKNMEVVRGFYKKKDSKNTFLLEYLNNLKYIKRNLYTKITSVKLNNAERKQQKEFYKTTIITNKDGLFINLLNSMLDLIVWIIGGLSVINGSLTLGALFAFSSYSARVASPFKNIANINYKAKEVSVSLERVKEILDNFKDEEVLKDLVNIDNITNLDFDIEKLRYGKNEPIVNSLNVSLKKGESLFVQGESGSGKSTILNTIFKGEALYDGNIRINQIDINKISKLSIFKNLAYLDQNNLIFKEESLKNNIIMGNRFDYTNYQNILEGCELKTIEQSEINKLSDISDLLSEGERQRVCIARTLYQCKDLIIFDEFASNIDIDMAKKILGYILQTCKESIIVVVSHRAELSNMCTKTIVINKCKEVNLYDRY